MYTYDIYINVNICLVQTSSLSYLVQFSSFAFLSVYKSVKLILLYCVSACVCVLCSVSLVFFTVLFLTQHPLHTVVP